MALRCTRQIYIDAGANWCNTLDLHHRLVPERRDVPWQVFAFEAMPRIAPHVERCAEALRKGAPLPTSPLPATGSTRDLRAISARFQCPPSMRSTQLYRCMLARLQAPLRALREDPALSSEERIRAQLDWLERAPCAVAGDRSNYTAIAAAVGDHNDTLHILDSDLALLIGGGTPAGWTHTGKRRSVPMIDLVDWIGRSVRTEDFVVLKLDVEGAEFGILESMLDTDIMPMIDVLHWECHGSRTSERCMWLRSRLARFGPYLQVSEEGDPLAE